LITPAFKKLLLPRRPAVNMWVVNNFSAPRAFTTANTLWLDLYSRTK
jgi:hypothetical protein